MESLFDLNKPAPSAVQIALYHRKHRRAQLEKKAWVSFLGVVLLCVSTIMWPLAPDAVYPQVFLLAAAGAILACLSVIEIGWVLFFAPSDRLLLEASPKAIDDLARQKLPSYASQYIRSIAEQDRVITNAELMLLEWVAAIKLPTNSSAEKAMERLLQQNT